MKQLFLILSLALFTLASCSKENKSDNEQNFTQFNLSKIEQRFFSLNKKVGLTSRNERSYRMTPAVMKVHRHILEENRTNRFVEGIEENVGTPLWNQAYTFNVDQGEYHVIVPLFNQERNLINGYISGMNKDNKILLNGMTRQSLLTNLEVNSGIKKSALTVLAKQEVLMKGFISPEIDSVLCVLSENIRANGLQTEVTELHDFQIHPCPPNLVEICIDQEGGYHWFGGMNNIPIHLDHDQDGIVNNEDQDWDEFKIRYNITQSSFTAFVKSKWTSSGMAAEYGDYDNFWDQFGEFQGDYEGGQDWSQFANYYQDFWEDFVDFWEDLWFDIEEIYYDVRDWFIDLFRDEIECPQWPLQSPDGDVSSRTIECFTFYAWDCLDNPDYNWWSFYNGYSDDDILISRVQNFLSVHIPGEVNFQTLYNIALDSDCDPLSSDFEQCLEWSFNNYRDAILVDMFEQVFDHENFLPMVRWLAKNCMLGAGTQAQYNACVMEQYWIAEADIELYLSSNGIDIPFDEFLDIYLDYCTTCNITDYENEVMESLGLAGADWTFDEEFWNDPNISFPAQNLPTYQAFYNAFPKKSNGGWLYGADNIYGLLGGAVAQARIDYPVLTNNTCALKVSIALNGSGVDIPNISGSTLDGGDGKYYFLNTLALLSWLKETFGDNPNQSDFLKFSIPNNAPLTSDLLEGNKGIYMMVADNPTIFGAKGHADIYTGSGCSGRCWFSDAKEMYLWILE